MRRNRARNWTNRWPGTAGAQPLCGRAEGRLECGEQGIAHRELCDALPEPRE